MPTEASELEQKFDQMEREKKYESVGFDDAMGLAQTAKKLKSGEKQTSSRKKGSAPSKEKPARFDAVKGTKWLLSSLNTKSVLKDSSITLTFAEGSIGGSAGCNGYGSKYTANNAGALAIPNPIIATEMFCAKPEGIMQQEKEYLDLLQTVTEYTINRNNLNLKTSDGGELVFNKMWSTIEGTKWLLSSLNTKSVLKDSNITLTFADGSIGGFDGCNTYGGEYTANDAGVLTIPDGIGGTLKLCGKGIMQQGKEYFDLLKTVTEYTINRNNLILKTSDGRELVFNKMS
jgi:heat shock protein HslJ